MSLEEAEAEMEKKHNSHFSRTSRLSKAIAANEGARNQYNHISYQCMLTASLQDDTRSCTATMLARHHRHWQELESYQQPSEQFLVAALASSLGLQHWCATLRHATNAIACFMVALFYAAAE